MSLSNILVPDDYNLYCNSLTFNGVTGNPTGYVGQTGATGATVLDTLWSNANYNPPHLFYGSQDMSPIGQDSSIFSVFATTNQILDKTLTNQILFPGALVSSPSYNPVNSTYTVPETGIYTFYVNVGLDITVSTANSVVVSTLYLYRNGGELRPGYWTSILQPGTGSYHHELTINWIGNLNAGDLITVVVTPAGGSGATFITNYSSNVGDSYFMGYEI